MILVTTGLQECPVDDDEVADDVDGEGVVELPVVVDAGDRTNLQSSNNIYK